MPGKRKRFTEKQIYAHKMPAYEAWRGMRQRCQNPKRLGYENYGGRGISVCSRWDSFSNFLEDMGARPSKLHTIERIDNSKGYEPRNCRWATMKEQHLNTRRTHMVEYAGKMVPLMRLIESMGIAINYNTIIYRLRRGWTLDDALRLPLRQGMKP